MRIINGERGDTIIEVLFAITVFSLIAVGGLSLMNQGTAMAQRALEIGLVRQQMDAQADALRYINKSYIADYGKGGPATILWKQVATNRAVNVAQSFGSVGDSDGCHMPGAGDNPYALDLTKLDSANPVVIPTVDTATYAKLRYDDTTVRAEGIWVQAVRSRTVIGGSDGKERPGFYDFHIRACWNSPGQEVPIVLGTIVRLYEPRG